jgi:predicted glycosyltransferase
VHILVDISHPAHVHFFRHAIDEWRERGHEVTIVSRDKDITLELLDQYGYRHTCLSRARRGLLGLGRELLEHEGRLYRLARSNPPDILVEIGGTFIVHAARLLGKPAVVFYDAENATISNAITYPFASAICTADCYRGWVGKGHIQYAGYHQLAYLHPHRFTPDPAVPARLGLNPQDTYFVVRFVGWQSGHDFGQRGFNQGSKIRLVKELERFGRVLITSEAPLPAELAHCRINLPSGLIHHLLAFSSLYIGESATMASESVVLGVPAIFVSPVGRGYTDEQEQRYQMCFTIQDENRAIDQAVELLRRPNLGTEWQAKRHRLLQDKIDVTAWLVDFVEEFVALNS